jgi:hypothetical protein
MIILVVDHLHSLPLSSIADQYVLLFSMDNNSNNNSWEESGDVSNAQAPRTFEGRTRTTQTFFESSRLTVNEGQRRSWTCDKLAFMAWGIFK